LDEILDDIGDFGRTKNDTLDNIFLVSLDFGFAVCWNRILPAHC